MVGFSQRLIQPNITLNRSETEERRLQAAAAVKPVLYKIKAGEMLLREGERVSEIQLLKLKAFEAQTKNEEVLAKSVGAAIIILCLLVGLFVLHRRNFFNIPGGANKNLLFIATMLLLFVFAAKISATLAASLAAGAPVPIPVRAIFYGIPLASGAMIICLFMGLEIAIPFYVSHMSFGALSKEAKLALAQGATRVGTAICSGSMNTDAPLVDMPRTVPGTLSWNRC